MWKITVHGSAHIVVRGASNGTGDVELFKNLLEHSILVKKQKSWIFEFSYFRNQKIHKHNNINVGMVQNTYKMTAVILSVSYPD